MAQGCSSDNLSVKRLSHRKVITVEDTALPRVLSLVDLTALGIGSTIGVGFYVLAGEAARNKAGPAVTVSFLVAAVASFFSGLCYAEFGGRVPKAGSAYIYTYVCIGEFIAFIIGWNLILEYLIGTASVASGFSGYIDAFTNNKIQEALSQAMPMNVPGLGPYPDLLAAGLCLVVALVLAFGVKNSTLANNIMTTINLFVVVYVIISAATQANVDNWHIPEDELNSTCPVPDSPEESWGTGGFAPYGFEGIMAGAATCFYGFVGFDVIASTGEEALRPERNLPLSICLSLFVIFLSYFGMSTVVTLAIPYCQQDVKAPLIHLYEYFDMETSKWIVSIGAIFGFSASLFGAIFPMPRIIYAMAADGMMFRPLSHVNKKFRSPVRATLLSGIFAATMAMLFEVDVLVNMMSIGTLQAYTIVALCVMMLRYSIDPLSPEAESLTKGSTPSDSFTLRDYLRQVVNRDALSLPNKLSTSFVSWATLCFAVACLVLTVLLVALIDQLKEGSAGAIVSVVLLALVCIAIVASIALQPMSSSISSFQVPLVPWLPAFSCFINLYLMCNLPTNTWYKFIIWMILGLAVYFFYGVLYGAIDAADLEQTEQRKKRGHDNASFSADGGKLASSRGSIAAIQMLEREGSIPTILVQPATPIGTPQGTMGADHPPIVRRSSQEVVVSPLVTVELKEKRNRIEEVINDSDNAQNHKPKHEQPENSQLSQSPDDKVSHVDAQRSEVQRFGTSEINVEKTGNSGVLGAIVSLAGTGAASVVATADSSSEDGKEINDEQKAPLTADKVPVSSDSAAMVSPSEGTSTDLLD